MFLRGVIQEACQPLVGLNVVLLVLLLINLANDLACAEALSHRFFVRRFSMETCHGLIIFQGCSSSLDFGFQLSRLLVLKLIQLAICITKLTSAFS